MCFRVKVTKSKTPVLETRSNMGMRKRQITGPNSWTPLSPLWQRICTCKKRKRSGGTPYFKRPLQYESSEKLHISDSCPETAKCGIGGKQMYRRIVNNLALGSSNGGHHKASEALIYIWPAPQVHLFALKPAESRLSNIFNRLFVCWIKNSDSAGITTVMVALAPLLACGDRSRMFHGKPSDWLYFLFSTPITSPFIPQVEEEKGGEKLSE